MRAELIGRDDHPNAFTVCTTPANTAELTAADTQPEVRKIPFDRDNQIADAYLKLSPPVSAMEGGLNFHSPSASRPGRYRTGVWPAEKFPSCRNDRLAAIVSYWLLSWNHKPEHGSHLMFCLRRIKIPAMHSMQIAFLLQLALPQYIPISF